MFEDFKQLHGKKYASAAEVRGRSVLPRLERRLLGQHSSAPSCIKYDSLHLPPLLSSATAAWRRPIVGSACTHAHAPPTHQPTVHPRPCTTHPPTHRAPTRARTGHPSALLQDRARFAAFQSNLADLVRWNLRPKASFYKGLHRHRWLLCSCELAAVQL